MNVKELIERLSLCPQDAPIVGAMTDEVVKTTDDWRGVSTVPEGNGYHADMFWDTENEQVVIELG